MNDKLKSCIATARLTLNQFTDDELDYYVQRVRERGAALEYDGKPFSRKKAIEEITAEYANSLVHDGTIASLNMQKYNKIKSRMNDGVKERSFLEKTNKNSDFNAETAQNARVQQLYNASFNEFDKETMDVLSRAEIDDEIYSAADGINTEGQLSPNVAKKLNAYLDARNDTLVRSTAMHPDEIREDRFFRNTYDAGALVKMGPDLFVQRMKQLVNLRETFKHTKAVLPNGELDEAFIEKSIRNTFNNIVQGNGVLFTSPVVAIDAVSVRKKQHMFYVFKDWRSWGMANKEFGQGTLLKAWMMDIRNSGKSSGIADVFGSNPASMWNEMRKIATEKEPLTVKNAVAREINDNLFKQITGFNRANWSPTLANVGASLRGLSSMSRLGNLVIRSLSDVSQIGAVAMRAGFSYWGSYFDAITHAFGLLSSEERRSLAKSMGAGLNTHMGYISRYHEANDMGGLVNRMSNHFFHWTAAGVWDNANKQSAMVPIMRGFGKRSDRSFEGLNKQSQSYLRKFNISSYEWNALRSKTEKNMFSVDNVDRLSNDEIRELWNKGDMLTPLDEYRNELYRKVFGMFDAAQENAVLNPTAFSHMATTFNTKSGTVGGEIVRMIMQFKSYPIQYMRRVWAGGMQDFDSYGAKFMYALNMSLGMFMLESLGQVLSALGNGLSPPDIRKMSSGERAMFLTKTLSGGMGVFGKIMDEHNQNKNLFGSFFNTASIRLASDPFISAFALATGNLEGAKKTMKDWAQVANPIGTIPGVSPYINGFLGQKPFMEPTQVQLFG